MPEESSTMESQEEQAPKIPAGISSLGQNLGTKAGITLKTGGQKIASGLGSIFGGVARGGGGLLVKAGGFGGDALARFSNQISRGSLIRGPSTKVWLGALLGFIFLFFILGGVGSLPTSTPTGEAAPISQTTATTNLAQCSFAGASGNLKAGNPALADLVNDIATKVGVPGSVLMGTLRIESPSAFTSKDANYLAADYDATKSSAGAIGIAQFLPATFSGIFLNNKDDIFRKFQKTAATVSIEPPTFPPPNDSLMRTTSIRDSIIMAAYKIKDDKNARIGSAKEWDEQATKAVARAYYGACSYQGASGSYCDDLAQSFSNCKVTYLADTGQIGQIVQGIQNACPGAIVIRSNLGCLDSVKPPLPKIVDDKIRESTITYGALQCVGYVKALASWVNGETLNDHGVANAYDYQGIPPQGFYFVPKTDNKAIMVGDIGVWNNAPNGHVAYVVAVDSANRFLITEASWGPQGYVRMDRRIDKLSEPGFQGFARKQQ